MLARRVRMPTSVCSPGASQSRMTSSPLSSSSLTASGGSTVNRSVSWIVLADQCDGIGLQNLDRGPQLLGKEIVDEILLETDPGQRGPSSDGEFGGRDLTPAYSQRVGPPGDDAGMMFAQQFD